MHTGTPGLFSSSKNLTSMPAAQEQQLLEQVHVLLVLEQRSVQRRYQLLGVVAAQYFGRNVLGNQQFDPVEELGGGRLLLQAGCFADLEERRQRLAQQIALEVREVHIDDLRHGRFVREPDVMEKTAPQERVGQFLFIVARGDDDGAVFRANRLARLIDVELHAVEFAQQIVGEFDVRLVDFVDQQDWLHLAV